MSCTTAKDVAAAAAASEEEEGESKEFPGRTIAIAVDDSDFSESAFQCK